MNKKFLASEEEYKSNVLPQEALKFSESSPFPGIKLPPNSFITFHAPEYFAMGFQVGTAYVVRMVAEYPTLFDIDIYQNYFDETGIKIERYGPNKGVAYHHVKELPGFIADQLANDNSPEGVRLQKRVGEHLKANLLNLKKDMEKVTFGQFLGRAWWFFLIAFGHAFRNAQDIALTGSTLGDIVVSAGIIFTVLFVYWLIKYGRK